MSIPRRDVARPMQAMSQCRSTVVKVLFGLFAIGLGGCASTGKATGQLRPAAQDPYLGSLVGEWSIERSIRGKVVGNHMSAEPILGGGFVRMHMTSTTPDEPYEAIVLVGFDPASGEYLAHWCDSFGPGYAAVGRGRREGARLELRFDYASGPFFNTWEFDAAHDRWSFVGESGAPDGSRSLFARDVVTRCDAGSRR
jgi:hypothetical protein